jgi:uncharacterized protein (DUF305 family)
MLCHKPSEPRAVFAVAAVLAAIVTLAACGGNDVTPVAAYESMATPAVTTPPPASFNDADVTFSQMMIMHHRKAVEMADLAAAHAANPQIKELAAKMKAGQEAEIATMRRWLVRWGKPVTPGAGMAEHNMPGAMSEQEMSKLKAARGAEVDKMFAQMMIAHHKGAIQMARDEQAGGVNPQAEHLAKTIEATQQAEILQLRMLLQRL